jgi:AraC-like DNA-binding protein
VRGNHDSASKTPAAASRPGELTPAGEEAVRQQGAAPLGADVLSDVLRAVRLTGALLFFVEASSPYLAEAPASARLAPIILPGARHIVSYHLIMEGSCYCELAGQPALLLSAGDVVVVPHGDAYALSSAPGMLGSYPQELVVEWFEQMAARAMPNPFLVVEGGGEPERRRILCGFLGCDALPFNPVLGPLPRLIHVRRPASDEPDRLSHLIAFAADEVREKRAGREGVLLRISELMFIEVLRRYLLALAPEQTGWLAALRDPVIGRALALLHERPSEPWTVEALAQHAGVSRSGLAERFAALVGQPPMQYLARWRMQLAAGLLAAEQAKVSAVALQVGYDSEAAFSRAFKALVGVTPAAWRKRALQS